MIIPFNRKIIDGSTGAWSERRKRNENRMRARHIRHSNYSNFVTDLTRFLEDRYQCSFQDVHRSLSFTQICIRSPAINLELCFKAKREQTLSISYVAFDDERVDNALALFEFFSVSAGRYGVDDFQVIRPTGIPSSFFETLGFSSCNSGISSCISRKELAKALERMPLIPQLAIDRYKESKD